MRILEKFIISPDALMVRKNCSPGRATTQPGMISVTWIYAWRDMPRIIAHPGNGKDKEKPKMTIKTDYRINFTHAENDQFVWDSLNPDTLTYKPTGQEIYQMMWYEYRNSKPIIDPTVIAAVTGFWDELKNLQTAPVYSGEPVDAIEEHGFGWCDKCHSYCYGDCAAN
jgi:hypothetical protein